MKDGCTWDKPRSIIQLDGLAGHQPVPRDDGDTALTDERRAPKLAEAVGSLKAGDHRDGLRGHSLGRTGEGGEDAGRGNDRNRCYDLQSVEAGAARRARRDDKGRRGLLNASRAKRSRHALGAHRERLASVAAPQMGVE